MCATLTRSHVLALHILRATHVYTAEGIEDCRKMCGGHGYLMASGIPELLGDYMQNPTVEGENTMLTQQVVGILLKALQGGKGIAAVGGDRQYLSEWKGGSKCAATQESDMLKLTVLHAAYRSVGAISCDLVRTCATSQCHLCKKQAVIYTSFRHRIHAA
jgi:acyl-CoA oxidase